ncbi:MAG: hypothetical protein EPO07_09170 [Verrucomicrobia bacterium]|nr:MAG: hypothetical protein EPO07_09170 [Verrucomicrobiota bacterium]
MKHPLHKFKLHRRRSTGDRGKRQKILRVTVIACALAGAFQATELRASENVPHAPFAEWADILREDELLLSFTYQESEAYYIWDGTGTRHNVDWQQNGEHYGIDINQGYFTFQYGINENWTADASVGFTALGWRYFANFSTNGESQSTTSLMDASFGVRYQILREDENSRWQPTLTFRAGAVLPGRFNEHFPFAPGVSSTAIEPEFLLRKHFGWQGLGFYADGLFRWNHTSGNDQYIVSCGLFQHIKQWELDVGYRHLQSISGDDIVFDPVTRIINYPRAVRENNDSIEAGFTYTTKKNLRVGFYSRTVFDGVNSDKNFWVGGMVTIPLRQGVAAKPTQSAPAAK